MRWGSRRAIVTDHFSFFYVPYVGRFTLIHTIRNYEGNLFPSSSARRDCELLMEKGEPNSMVAIYDSTGTLYARLSVSEQPHT